MVQVVVTFTPSEGEKLELTLEETVPDVFQYTHQEKLTLIRELAGVTVGQIQVILRHQ